MLFLIWLAIYTSITAGSRLYNDYWYEKTNNCGQNLSFDLPMLDLWNTVDHQHFKVQLDMILQYFHPTDLLNIPHKFIKIDIE